MSLKKFVKLSKVNNLSDARYGAGMGIDLIGFPLDPDSPDHISPEKFNEISSWISGPGIVGEFHNTTPEKIIELAEMYSIDYIEISNPEYLVNCTLTGKSIIISLDISHYRSLDELESVMQYSADFVSMIILEKTSTSDISIKEIQLLAHNFDLLVGFDITADSIKKLILPTALKGISIKGGAEIKTGFKDYDEIADILEVLEED
jgi:phosphoribosylanthranilate isomerase